MKFRADAVDGLFVILQPGDHKAPTQI